MAVQPIAVLGGVLLDAVKSDRPTHAFDVTEKGIEDGSSIADHMKERPPVLPISGVIVGPDAWPRLNRIRQMQSDRQLVTYANRVIYRNMAIVSISTEHDATIGNGCKFNITLRRVRRVASQQVQVSSPTPMATKAMQPQNAGTQQVRSTGKQSNNKAADSILSNRGGGFNGGGAGGTVSATFLGGS